MTCVEAYTEATPDPISAFSAGVAGPEAPARFVPPGAAA